MSALSIDDLLADEHAAAHPEEKLRRMLERRTGFTVRALVRRAGRWYASVVITDGGITHDECRSIDELLHERG